MILQKGWSNLAEIFEGAAKSAIETKRHFKYPQLVEPFTKIILSDFSKEVYDEDRFIEFMAKTGIALILVTQLYYEHFSKRLEGMD